MKDTSPTRTIPPSTNLSKMTRIIFDNRGDIQDEPKKTEYLYIQDPNRPLPLDIIVEVTPHPTVFTVPREALMKLPSFFKTCLQEDESPEAMRNRIKLNGHNPDTIRMLLEYLTHGTKPEKTTEPLCDEQLFKYLNLYIAAVPFYVESLQNHMVDFFRFYHKAVKVDEKEIDHLESLRMENSWLGKMLRRMIGGDEFVWVAPTCCYHDHRASALCPVNINDFIRDPEEGKYRWLDTCLTYMSVLSVASAMWAITY